MSEELPLPVAATAEFLLQHLGPAGRRVLEVGCGNGAVAAAMVRAGHEVVALDADPDMVATARGRGVDARCVRWPEFAGEGFDAVAFTRSLHHLRDLDAALRHAVDVLVPHGLLLIEDLAHEAVDLQSLRWFRKVLTELDGDGVLRSDPKLRANRLLRGDDLMAAWQEDRPHDLHSFATMAAAVEDAARPNYRAEVPYFYRYVAEAAVPGAESAAAVARVLREEERSARRSEIIHLGRRLVARTPLAG